MVEHWSTRLKITACAVCSDAIKTCSPRRKFPRILLQQFSRASKCVTQGCLLRRTIHSTQDRVISLHRAQTLTTRRQRIIQPEISKIKEGSENGLKKRSFHLVGFQLEYQCWHTNQPSRTVENNPQVMTKLAHTLGLSQALSFHDTYSLTEPDLLAVLPRPANALLFTYPCTTTSEANFAKVNEAEPNYQGSGPGEPVMFYHQTITHACGLIGLLHCTTNGAAADLIQEGSDLDKLVRDTRPLNPTKRAQLLHDSDMLERAHSAAAENGDSKAPPLGEDPGNAFIAFVKGKDGHLWELEGRRKGPVDLGLLTEDEDVLCDKALNLGPIAFLKREESAGSGDMRFSCTVLAPSVDD